MVYVDSNVVYGNSTVDTFTLYYALQFRVFFSQPKRTICVIYSTWLRPHSTEWFLCSMHSPGLVVNTSYNCMVRIGLLTVKYDDKAEPQQTQ
jgi:hypothetical protein